MQEAESLTEVTSSNWVANHLCYKWGKGSMVSSATGSTAQADTAPTGGYITWVVGRVSAAYCQLVGMLSTWGHRGKGPVTYIAVCECSMASLRYGTCVLGQGRRVLGCWKIQQACTH